MTKTPLRKYRWISVILLAALILMSGYKRDRVFYYLDARIQYEEGNYHRDFAKEYLPDSEFKTIYNQDLDGLYKEKWIQTGKFTIIYFLIAFLGLILFETDKSFFKYLLYLYLALTLIGFLAYGLDYVISMNNLGYTIAMFLMHILQSPLPLFIFIPAQVLLTYKKK